MSPPLLLLLPSLHDEPAERLPHPCSGGLGQQASTIKSFPAAAEPGVGPEQVQFNVNRVDNMVIQAIALLDTLDRDINTFVMRVREWYSWHFPELIRIVPDNYQYSRLALQIKNKSDLTEAALPGMALADCEG